MLNWEMRMQTALNKRRSDRGLKPYPVQLVTTSVERQPGEVNKAK